MKVLHIVGNKIEPANGIGRLVPEMIVNHNSLGEGLESSLLVLSGNYSSTDFAVYNLDEIQSFDVFFTQFDLVVFHGMYFYQYIKISNILTRTSIPYLIKPHSSLMFAAQRKSKLKKTIANFVFFKRFFKRSKGVLFTNLDEMTNSLKWSDKWFVEPNGLDFSFSGANLKISSGCESFKFIYLSRIDFSHKGTDQLLDALSIIKSKNLLDKFSLDIYGKGSVAEEGVVKKRLLELGSPNIVFKGPAYGSVKVNAFNNGDIFILTSRYEGFPMAILEALHFGLPCIVTPGANMTSILSSNNVGWLTEGNPESIANTMIKANSISTSCLSEMSLTANKYVHDHHNWQTVVNTSRYIFQEVIEAAR
ncbi:glycosyltransferase [Shewanella sp. HL-SH8]|uniref:glycosyltransferase n=1 Tax=Shewanella sp. HL-SH8 TaxID=3436242 RepID=UPI003EBBE780